MTTRLAATAIPKTFPVRPLKPSDKAEDPATCGTCGLSWDDAIPTSMTPAPSARCPFEGFHHAAPVPGEVEWSGSCDPCDPANYWIDDETGERVSAITGERTQHSCAPSEQVINGQTWDQWATSLFEFESCAECGKDKDAHDPAVLMGNWFARCREQEVTPEHSPLPWDLQIGKQCCFHDGNRVALTVWHGLDTEEPTNETIAEFWPASNDLDIKDAKFVLEAVNSHAELKERVRVL